MVMQIDLDDIIARLEKHLKTCARVMEEKNISPPERVGFEHGFGACMDALKHVNESFKQQVKASKAGSN